MYKYAYISRCVMTIANGVQYENKLAEANAFLAIVIRLKRILTKNSKPSVLKNIALNLEIAKSRRGIKGEVYLFCKIQDFSKFSRSGNDFGYKF